MSRLFIDGFETGDTSLWETNINVEIVASTDLNMSGEYVAKYSNNTSNRLIKTIPLSTQLNINFRWRWNVWSAASMYRFLQFKNSNDLTVTSLGFYNNYFYIYNWLDSYITYGNLVTFDTDTTYRMNIYYLPKNDASGRVVIKMDDVIYMNYTGNNIGTNITGIAKLSFGDINGSAAHLFYLDDIIVDDTDEIPSVNRVLKPTYELLSSDLTPSEGDVLDCIAIDDDKYIVGGTIGNRLKLNIASNPIIKNVFSVQSTIKARRTSAVNLAMGINDGENDLVESAEIEFDYQDYSEEMTTVYSSGGNDYLDDKNIYFELKG